MAGRGVRGLLLNRDQPCGRHLATAWTITHAALFDHPLQELERGQQLILLPKQCQLTYDEESKPELLGLIEQVPQELWGARLALQVSISLES